MFVISAIVPASRRAGRFDVVVDGLSVATLSLDAIERLGLAIGSSVEGVRERLEQESARLCVYDRAIALLAFRARSSAELVRILVRKGEDREHADWAVSRLMEQGLLDDAAFARAFTHAKIVGAHQSRRRVQQDLARKGISRSVADAAIDTVFEEEGVDQREIVLDAGRRKLRTLRGLEPPVRRRRLYAFLARRGYDADDIRTAMTELGAGHADESDP